MPWTLRSGRPRAIRAVVVARMTDFRSLTREFWCPEDPRAWVRKQPGFGWRWAINFAAVVRRLRRRR
jgi:hypothetical protein